MKLTKILHELENTFNSFEEPSHFPQEKEAIQEYVDAVKQSHPNGIKTTEVFDDLAEASITSQITVLIELAKAKLLKLGMSGMRVTPEQVLKIYGNPKGVIDYQKRYGVEPSLNEKKMNFLDILHEIQKEQRVDEGWKENVVAAALSVATMLGNVRSQNTSNPSSTKTDSVNVPMGTLFSSGMHSLKNVSEDSIEAKLRSIGEYIKKYPSSNIEITINSSESQVTNYDAEEPGKPKLQSGSLAQKRAEAARFLVDTFLKDLKDKGVFKGEYTIKEPNVQVGKTAYSQGEDPKQSKFTQEQFVNITVKVINKSTINSVPEKSYHITSNDRQTIFDEARHAIAFMYWAVKNGEHTDTQHEDVLLKMIDQNGRPTSDEYLVPWTWWNKNVFNNKLTSDNLQKLKQISNEYVSN